MLASTPCSAFVALAPGIGPGSKAPASWSIANRDYEITLTATGEVRSSTCRGYDVTRRSYDFLDPSGRALFLVEPGERRGLAWPIVGNFPVGRAEGPSIGTSRRLLADHLRGA